MDERGSLSFMEMNTRMQVEHPVTELVTGIDLVAEQIRIAAGEAPSFSSPTARCAPRGHALECRINAEDPVTFAPWPGLITEYHPPGGAGVRVDGGIYGGWRVPGDYDSLLAKIITHGRTRAEAIARMRAGPVESIVSGIRTNVALHRTDPGAPGLRRGTPLHPLPRAARTAPDASGQWRFPRARSGRFQVASRRHPQALWGGSTPSGICP